MGFLICSECKSYYKLQSDESRKDFVNYCDCGGKLRYVENLDIVDPTWRSTSIRKKSTKKEILSEKIKSVFFIGKINPKKRLAQFYDKFKRRINNAQNQHRIYNTPYGTGNGFINSLMNEINFHNIHWALVIPVAVAITIILTITQGFFTLIIFILLITVGYLSKSQILGVKNALVAGAISFFFGSLFTGSFLLLIPFTLLGALNGAICGWIGGYIKIRMGR